MLDTFKLWGEQVFGWYYFVERSIYEPNEDGHGGHYVNKRIKKRLINKQYLTDAFGDPIYLWTYQEAKMTPDEFTAYASLVSSKDAITNTTINNQLIIMNAIADLYERISRI